MGGVKHDYILDGTKILREGWNYDEETKTYRDVLIPLYDNEDSVCGIIYNGVPYYFQKNLQGDVIAITNKNGDVISRYSYDAWGACTSAVTHTELTDGVDIANINPFRYRGYYFDKEIEMYYLQSRYYDPKTSRILSADQPMMLTLSRTAIPTNLYLYSDNDCINNYDIDGYFTLKSVFRNIKSIISIGWTGVSIKLSKTVSIIFAVLTLIYRVFAIVSDIRSIHKMLNNKMATAIVAALPYGSSVVSFEIIAWLCNFGAVVAVMSVILSFFAASCTGGLFELARTAVLFVISYVAPTMIAAIQMLYYGFKKNRGCTYMIKYLGGSTVSF